MYKVSVIIPVYNAENSLKHCINSVINQTIGFENIELILVDDNSSDGSKSIIMDYANEYDNIKPVFSGEMLQPVSSAREAERAGTGKEAFMVCRIKFLKRL